MDARIRIVGNDLFCTTANGQELRIPLDAEELDRLRGWKSRYVAAVAKENWATLMAIGTALFTWIDISGWASAWVAAPGRRCLEIAVENTDAEFARGILDLPWELLAYNSRFLAADATQLFEIYRSIGRSRDAKPATPSHQDLSLMFMAASPEGVSVLNFEEEESALLNATSHLSVQVSVEESGCAEFLKERLHREGPFEIVHISCHGDIADSGPILAFESPEGSLVPITPADFSWILGEQLPLLVFLSACMTAAGNDTDSAIIAPFVRELIRAGVPNVLGWDGSVYDSDATFFAEIFYGELAHHSSAPYAAARARQALLNKRLEDPKSGRHWHLARVYAGPQGAGACCVKNGKKRRQPKEPEYLDPINRRVPVAPAQEFVGRRRQIQKILRAFHDHAAPGVLIFGMGNLGKSSLAARIAHRKKGAHTAVILYERYDALAVFDQLVEALPPDQRKGYRQSWRDEIAGDNAVLKDALEAMLAGPFNTSPILLIVDDLERILEAPQPNQELTPVKPEYRSVLIALLRAFKAASGPSHLLLTSRFDFTLPDGRGGDAAAGLMRLQIPPMAPEERIRQWRAAQRMAEKAIAPDSDLEELAARARNLAGGNPGLQEILCRPLLRGEASTARQAMESIERWKASGEIPEEANTATEFFERIAFEVYAKALRPEEHTQLRGMTLFSEGIAIPMEALEEAGRSLGAPAAGDALRRLIALGLADDWGKRDGFWHGALNSLARPLAGTPLSAAEAKDLAGAVIEILGRTWRDSRNNFYMDCRGVEAARLALMGPARAALIDAAALAAGIFLFRRCHDA